MSSKKDIETKQSINKIYITICILGLLFIVNFIAFAFQTKARYENNYNTAKELLEDENYSAAIEILNSLKGYKDVNILLSDTKNKQDKKEAYELGLEYMNKREYTKATKQFIKADGYKDSELQLAIINVLTIEESKETLYKAAIQSYKTNEHIKAFNLFNTISEYKDSSDYLHRLEQEIASSEVQTQQ